MMIMGTIILLLMGLAVVADAYGSNIKAHSMDWLVFFWKGVGATLGSAVAIIFKPGGGWHSLLSRFIIGLIMGVIFAPVFRDWMHWPPTFDYWLASATSCGLTGYLVLQILYSQEIITLVKNKLSGTKSK